MKERFSAIFWTGVAFLLLACYSCRKGEDAAPPVVTVITPLSVPTLTVPDSILVVVEVSDNVKLENIQVGLVNSERIHVSDPVTYHPEASFFRMEQYVRATDKGLASGDYFILIYASDGVNTKSKYLPLTINELPLEIRGYMLVKRPGPEITTAEYLTDSFALDTIIRMEDSFHATGIDPLSELFYLVSSEPSAILAFPLRKAEAEWVIQAAMPLPAYTGLFFDTEVVAGTENGDIWIYDHTGQVIINTQQAGNRKVREVAASSSFITCEMVSINGNEHYIYMFYRQTGGLRFNRKISGEIAAICPVEDYFLVFCNAPEGVICYELKTEDGEMTHIYTLNGETLSGACQGPAGRIFLNTGESVFLYDITQKKASLFLAEDAAGLVFDPLNSILYYYSAGGYGKTAYPSGMNLGFYASDTEVVTFHIIYNRQE